MVGKKQLEKSKYGYNSSEQIPENKMLKKMKKLAKKNIVGKYSSEKTLQKKLVQKTHVKPKNSLEIGLWVHLSVRSLYFLTCYTVNDS